MCKEYCSQKLKVKNTRIFLGISIHLHKRLQRRYIFIHNLGTILQFRYYMINLLATMYLGNSSLSRLGAKLVSTDLNLPNLQSINVERSLFKIRSCFISILNFHWQLLIHLLLYNYYFICYFIFSIVDMDQLCIQAQSHYFFL